MLSRLVYLLTGVYGGVVVDQALRKHKVLETWAPHQVWERAKSRVDERIQLWKGGHRSPGFSSKSIKSENDNADEDSKNVTETLRNEKAEASAGDRGLEEKVSIMKDIGAGEPEIFQEKIKIWTVKEPEVHGMMEEKMKLIKERVPIIQGMVEEKIQGFKSDLPDIKEKFQDKIKDWKDKGPDVKEVVKEKIRTLKEHAVVGGEVVSERVKVLKDASSKVKDILEEKVKTVEENVANVGEINEESKPKEKIAEVAQESENVVRDLVPEFGVTEGKGDNLKASSPDINDLGEANGDMFKDNSSALKQVIDGNKVRTDNYPKLKQTFSEKEEMPTDFNPEITNIEDKEKVTGEVNFENNDMLNESLNGIPDNCSQLKEMEDKKSTSKEDPENSEIVKEIACDAQGMGDDAKLNLAGKSLAEQNKATKESANDVNMILQENMKTLKQTAPEVTELLKGKMNSLKETAPEVTEILKGKINALKRKFTREEATTELNVKPKHEPAKDKKG